MKKPVPEFDVAGPIISKWPGGIGKMAVDLGLSYRTVHAWSESRNIPEKWRLPILRAAKRVEAPVTPFDFIAYMVTIPDEIAA